MTKQRLMTHARYASIALASALTLFAAGCGKKPAAQGPGGAAAAQGTATASAIAVSAQPVVSKNIDKTVDVTGSLVALQDVVVGAKIAGKLVNVYLHEGDPVRAGQVVAVMDTADFNAQLQQAQANVQAAITKEQQARVQLAQAHTQYQQAQTTLKYTDQTTKTGVAVARAGLQTAQERLSLVKAGARQQERQQAAENVAAAKANYDKARADLKRYQSLFRDQAISQSQLDQTQASFDAAQASYNSALQAQSMIQEGARPQDIRQAELAVQQAQDSLTKAQADRANVRLRSEDVQNAKSGIAAAEAGIKAAQAGVAQAQASLRMAQDALANAYIKSPISGYVAERRAEPGSQLGGGAPVMRIVNPGTVYFEAALSESQYGDVRLGQTATINIDAMPGRTFTGRVTRILPVASQARSFDVRIDFPTNNQMRPQMFARGSILIDTHRNATLVPKDAVIFGAAGDSARVFVVGEDGTARQRTVKVGYSNPLYVEVLDGVKPGEKVITAGQNALQNGDKIRVQQG